MKDGTKITELYAFSMDDAVERCSKEFFRIDSVSIIKQRLYDSKTEVYNFY
jgi:hypothetical protein